MHHGCRLGLTIVRADADRIESYLETNRKSPVESMLVVFIDPGALSAW
jgi:hypothetical protein